MLNNKIRETIREEYKVVTACVTVPESRKKYQ